MRIPLQRRKWLALLCLALLVFAVLTPQAATAPFAVLNPICLFIELLVMLAVLCAAEDEEAHSPRLITVTAIRPPPAA